MKIKTFKKSFLNPNSLSVFCFVWLLLIQSNSLFASNSNVELLKKNEFSTIAKKNKVVNLIETNKQTFQNISIQSFSPNMASTGTAITISGSGFLGTTSVSFGTSLAQSFTVISDTEIVAIVSGGASGDISISTPTGKASLGGFVFLDKPVISYLPVSTPKKTIVNNNTIHSFTHSGIRIATLLATLSNLTISSGTLNPSFDPSITEYTDTVSNATTSVTVTPDNTGTASKDIPLNVGTTAIYIVAAGDGATTQTYTIYVTRLSNDPTLGNLTTSYGNLDQTFDPASTQYSQSVNGGTNSITVTPTASYPYATIKVNNQTVASGSASQNILLNYGHNTITIISTSQDGSATQTYTIDEYRQSDDATLSSLIPSTGSLKPNFDPAITSYIDTVSNSTSSITFTPTFNSQNGQYMYIYLNDQYVQYLYSGNTSQNIPINIGKNNFSILAYAEDFTSKYYNITVVRLSQNLTNDASLSNLITSQGILSPSFTPTITNYNTSVSNDTTSITLTPITANSNAIVKVNGIIVSSGNASPHIPLKAGKNTITIIVTAQDGITNQTYTLVVTREANHNAALSNLILSNGVLSPSFSSNTTSYTANVSYATSSITITPITVEAKAFVTLNGNVINSGNTSGSIPLNVGNNSITIVGIAPDSITTLSYTININRAANQSSTLSNLATSSGTLSPAFSATTTSYSVSVSNVTNSITITPTTTDASATVKVNGVPVVSGSASASIALSIGNNTINIIVTAPDGINTQTYTVTVTRAASNNSALSSLITSNGILNPSFSPTNLNYSTSVSNGISNITVTPTSADPTATITVNNVIVNSGTSSANISLSEGSNIITTVVTAQDGITKQTYTITVTRASISLSNLSISNGTLSPSFSSSTTSYNAVVSNTINNIIVTPTSSDVNSTITVNNIAVNSGAASGSIPLSVGSNTITIVLTGQDGITKKTYTITITRSPSSIALLSNLTASNITLNPIFSSSTTSYTANANNTTSSITITPTTSDPNATVTINGSIVTSGTASSNIQLILGNNIITIIVTAQDGISKQTYTLTITKTIGTQTITFNPLAATTFGVSDFSPGATVNSNLAINYSSSNTNVATIINNNIHVIAAGQTQISASVQGNSEYTAASTVTQNLIVNKAKQIIQVPSQPPLPVVGASVDLSNFSTNSGLPLSFEVSDPTMATVIGNILQVHKAGIITLIVKQEGNNNYNSTEASYIIDVSLPDIVVTPALTPNGDGIDDYLLIKGLELYPNNTVTLLNRNGVIIYKASGYDNSTTRFDGRSNFSNDFQPAGTYIYIVDFNNNGIKSHLSGYFVLKY